MAEPINVIDTDFEREVLQADVPVLVDFWASWCGPCRMIAPAVKEIASDYDGQLKVVKIDADENPMSPGRYAVMGLPTLMIFKDGQVVERWSGAQPKEVMVQKIAPHLDPIPA